MPHNFQKSDRRLCLKQLGAFSLAFPVLRSAAVAFPDHDQKDQLLYVGTYTTGTASEGIYAYRLDPINAKLTADKITSKVVDPSFLTVDGTKRYLYAVNETDEFNGMK